MNLYDFELGEINELKQHKESGLLLYCYIEKNGRQIKINLNNAHFKKYFEIVN
jgi:hypothetical protein